ncbi:hypothetical protein KAR91_72930 [Candidatus Pacearchaeota archaeon]|nr:hypothetical protein [Candidatus Pacearchaeota archaeon]
MNKAIPPTPKHRGATLAELVVEYHEKRDGMGKWVLKELIEKWILRGECGRID